MHLAPFIGDLAVILAAAGVVTLLFKRIRQPVILGYLLAGVLVGPHTSGLILETTHIRAWAELGVVFLMFSLGLEFTFHKLVRVGKQASGTAIIEVVAMLLLGYTLGGLLGWEPSDRMFLGAMLAISSTTIILKSLESLNLKSRGFAEVVFGVLIVEDVVAILLLAALSTLSFQQSVGGVQLLYSLARFALIVGSWVVVGYFLIPTFFKYAGRFADEETLTVISTGLCLLLVLVASQFNYSPALGAFIMGSILAETAEAGRIETLIRPLRDLFAAVFFVSVGMLMDPAVLRENAAIIGIISLTFVFGKISFCIMGALATGQTLKRSIQVGFSLAQIGEFSFIIASLGTELQITSQNLYPIAVGISALTTFLTPFLIRASELVALKVGRWLPMPLLEFIEDYSRWMQRPKLSVAGDRYFSRAFFRFFLNGILVTMVFWLVDRYGARWVTLHVQDGPLSQVILWGIGIMLSAPFIWGMFFSARPRDEETNRESPFNLLFFLVQLGTILWVGGMSARFFATTTALLLTFVGTAALFFLFYTRLESSYRWFEKRFLSNVRGEAKETKAETYLKSLAPWDLHLARVRVPSESPLAGETLRDTGIRESLGLNIAVIRRGRKVLVSPPATERIFPGDELLLLATDEQVDRLEQLLHSQGYGQIALSELENFSLAKQFIAADSPLVGKSIRESGLRERGLVLGLERGTLRITNPDPATLLQPGDLLWVVRAEK